MARLPRLVIPGLPHHIILRSNNRQPAFLDDADHQAWLDALREAAALTRTPVHAYVLLPDRVQLLVTPPTGTALSTLMQSTGRRYGGMFNRRHGRAGTLWEGRFRAGVIEPERYLIDVSLCIECSPVAEGLATAPELWPWSSQAHHLGLRIDPVVTDHPAYWALGNTPFERQAAWRRMAEQGLASSLHERILATAAKGWALGSPAFLERLGEQTSRPLAPRPRGRPRKGPAEDHESVPN